MPARRRRTPSSEPAALTVAVRQAARFDRQLVSVAAGLLAAIPVMVLFGAGIAARDPVTAATMGAGAMLVGVAWRTGGGRPPLAMMAADAMVMATATFVGSVTGSVAWIHLVVLCVWSLLAGLLVAVGNRGAVVGTQAIIAAVVFGRFSQPASGALGLAGLVLAGGLAQVIFLSVVRWPPPLRSQRAATATAYGALSAIAEASSDTSTLPAAAALDDAESSLASATLFADPAVLTLRSLVSEGHRMRVQLTAIHALLGREWGPAADRAAETTEAAGRVLKQAGAALELAARAIEGDERAAEALSREVAVLSARASEVARDARTTPPAPVTRFAASRTRQIWRRLRALEGQLRAVAALAPSAGQAAGLRSRRPYRATNRPIERLRAGLEQIRANATLDSPAGRHALRLAVVVPAAEVISRQLPVQRGYWMVVAAATVLRPEFGATFTRGTERALGTCLGVALAGAIAVGLHPAGAVTVVIVWLLAWAGYAVFPASFAVGFAFITALVVFLLNALSPDTLQTASSRLLDTLIGGAIGLLAYALWPTWSRVPARQSLGELVHAQRAYVGAVLTAAIDGRRATDQQMRPLARRARLARTNAEAAVARSLSEPATRRIDAEESQASLGAMRRLIQAAHVLRLSAQEPSDRRTLPALRPLGTDLDRLMEIVEMTLRAGSAAAPSPATTLPDLRADYLEFERACPDNVDSAVLLAELDEIVDATNGLAVISGIGWIDSDETPPPRRRGIPPGWIHR